MKILFIALFCSVCLSVFAVEDKPTKKEEAEEKKRASKEKVKTKAPSLSENEIKSMVEDEMSIDKVIEKFGKPHSVSKSYSIGGRVVEKVYVTKYCEWKFDNGTRFSMSFGLNDKLRHINKEVTTKQFSDRISKAEIKKAMKEAMRELMKEEKAKRNADVEEHCTEEK